MLCLEPLTTISTPRCAFPSARLVHSQRGLPQPNFRSCSELSCDAGKAASAPAEDGRMRAIPNVPSGQKYVRDRALLLRPKRPNHPPPERLRCATDKICKKHPRTILYHIIESSQSLACAENWGFELGESTRSCRAAGKI